MGIIDSLLGSVSNALNRDSRGPRAVGPRTVAQPAAQPLDFRLASMTGSPNVADLPARTTATDPASQNLAGGIDQFGPSQLPPETSTDFEETQAEVAALSAARIADGVDQRIARNPVFMGDRE